MKVKETILISNFTKRLINDKLLMDHFPLQNPHRFYNFRQNKNVKKSTTTVFPNIK